MNFFFTNLTGKKYYYYNCFNSIFWHVLFKRVSGFSTPLIKPKKKFRVPAPLETLTFKMSF